MLRPHLRSAFLLVIPLLGSVLTVSTSYSQPFWQQTNGPAGSYATEITRMPDGDMFVLSDVILRSTDLGHTWTNVSDTLPFGFISDIHATSEGALLALNWDGRNWHKDQVEDYREGIFISLDKGSSWRYQTLARRPWGMTSTPDGKIYLSAGNHWLGEHVTFRSIDNGATWDTTTAMTSPTSGFLHLFADSSGVLLTHDTRSTDEGVSWAKLTNGFQMKTPMVQPLVHNGSIYKLTQRSTDHGRTWSEFSNKIFSAMAIDAEGTVLDGWSTTTPPLMNSSGDVVYTRGMEKFNYLNIEEWPSAIALEDTSFLYLRNLGMWTWKRGNSDSSWEERSIPTGSPIALAAHPNGTIVGSTEVYPTDTWLSYLNAWYSTDNGTSWKRSEVDGRYLEGFYSFAIDSSAQIIAGGRGKVYVSVDSGKTYTASSQAFGGQDPIRAIAVASNGSIFVANGPHGVFRSTDNGETWDQLNSGIKSSITSIGVDPDGKVYAGSLLTVYVTTNDGLTWTPHSSGFPSPGGSLGGQITALVVNNQGYLLAAVDSFGMYVSIDDGANWQELNTGLGNLHITALLNTPSDKVFASTGNGVYYLASIVDSWTEAMTGLTVRSTLSLARNPAGNVFVGAMGTGVLRSSQTYNIAAPSTVSGVEQLEIIRISPNPVSRYLHIEIDRQTEYQVLDVMGRVVLAGSTGASIDVSDLSSGSYFLRLEGEKPIAFVKQ